MANLEYFKTQAIEARYELERIIELSDMFRDHSEALARVLAGEMPAEDFEVQHLTLRKELESEEYRFLEWNDGTQAWNSAVQHLTFEPGLYRTTEPAVFARDVLEASIIFDKMIRDKLRELYRLNDHIEALSDERTARTITKVDPAEKLKLSQRIKTLDDNLDVGIKWGGRVITALPHVQKLIESFG